MQQQCRADRAGWHGSTCHFAINDSRGVCSPSPTEVPGRARRDVERKYGSQPFVPEWAFPSSNPHNSPAPRRWCSRASLIFTRTFAPRRCCRCSPRPLRIPPRRWVRPLDMVGSPAWLVRRRLLPNDQERRHGFGARSSVGGVSQTVVRGHGHQEPGRIFCLQCGSESLQGSIRQVWFVCLSCPVSWSGAGGARAGGWGCGWGVPAPP